MGADTTGFNSITTVKSRHAAATGKLKTAQNFYKAQHAPDLVGNQHSKQIVNDYTHESISYPSKLVFDPAHGSLKKQARQAVTAFGKNSSIMDAHSTGAVTPNI